MLASKRNGTLYISVTSDLLKRVYEHKTHAVDGFTKKYSVTNLIGLQSMMIFQKQFFAKNR